LKPSVALSAIVSPSSTIAWGLSQFGQEVNNRHSPKHLPFDHIARNKHLESQNSDTIKKIVRLRTQFVMEQENCPQSLSAVINAPTISSFFSSDASHLSIFDTLLESHVTGVDSEIRTEYEGGKAIRFPVLTLCLDGLDRLLEKHELARQELQKKIDLEGGNPGVCDKLIQSLPLARMGFLSAAVGGDRLQELQGKMEADNAENLAKLKSRLEAEYAEKEEKRNSEHLQELANLRQKQGVSGRS